MFPHQQGIHTTHRSSSLIYTCSHTNKEYYYTHNPTVVIFNTRVPTPTRNIYYTHNSQVVIFNIHVFPQQQGIYTIHTTLVLHLKILCFLSISLCGLQLLLSISCINRYKFRWWCTSCNSIFLFSIYLIVQCLDL